MPYQQDLSAEMQQLREDIFVQGGYLSGIGITRADLESALQVCGADTQSVLERFAIQASDPKLPPQTRKKFALLMEQFKQLGDTEDSLSKPITIEELLERQGERGTHSI